MDRHALGRLLGNGALVVTLIAGCSHAHRSPMNGPIISMSQPATSAVAAGPSGAVSQPTVVSAACSNCQPTTVAAASPTCQPAAPAVCAPCQPVVASSGCVPCQPQVVTVGCTNCPPTVVAPAAAVEVIRVSNIEPAPAPGTAGPVRQVSVWQGQPAAAPRDAQGASFPRAENPQPRRSYSDITASSCFGHAPDYSWLVGQVEKSRLGTGWRLRYSSVDENDAHGGSVTLAGDGNLPTLRDGQYIRVHGHLASPDDRGAAPGYHVDSFEPVQ